MTDHDVIIIGAGFGGMGAAISLKRLGYDDISILEREDDLGGTWHVNRYPGLAVDIASVTYSYSFEPNPYWKHWFARGPELKQYAEHVADKYDLRRHMEFGVLAEGARWDEDAQHWVLTTRRAPSGAVGGGRRKTRTAKHLMTATGFLSQPKLPDIDGVEDFAGTVVHTAKWDDSIDLDGKRIAVIGTGATAVQLIPRIAERAGHLTVFQRTPIWVTPKGDFKIPGPVQMLFAAQPWTQRIARRANSAWLEGMMVTAVLHYKQAKLLNQGAATLAKAHLRRQVDDPETRRKLTPDYSFGCKRPTFSNDYYPTFNRPNVDLETTPIARITPTGIVTSDGVEREIDVLVLATGFNLWDTNFPAIEIIGRDGKDLGKSWRTSGYHAFEGVSVAGFPNFISLNSPYSYSGLSYFMTIEVQMRHIERVFGELAERGAETFEVTAQADAEFLEHMLERMDDTVFNQGSCGTARSYYYTNEGDAVLLRPTSSGSARRAVEEFPIEDYAFA